MHIASTTTSTKSIQDIPVLVLACSDAEGTINSRKFVARPSHYRDLAITARKIFDFKTDATLVFGTSTLDVCRGAWIEIDESAYEPLLEYLDEVIVRPRAPDVGADEAVVETAKVKTRQVDRTGDPTPLSKAPTDSLKLKGRQESQPDTSASVVGGSSILVPPGSISIRDEPKTRTEPLAPTQPFSSPSRPKSKFISTLGSAPNVAPKFTESSLLTRLDEISKLKPKPLSNHRQRKPEPQPEPEPESKVQQKPKLKFRPASATRQTKKEPYLVLGPEPSRARQRKPEPELELETTDEGDEEDEDHEPPSSAKAEEASGTGRKEEEDDDFWRFGTKSVGPSTSSSRTQREPVSPPSNPPSNPKLTRTGTTIHVEVKKEPEEKKGKTRDARARLSTVNATQLPRASTRDLAHFDQDPEVRFMVTVHGPRADQDADFRTRGGHKIKKVLESACKTFELPFERSRLVLEDDSREIKQYYCDPEDTVGSCGIDADSRLLVQVDGMTDDDLDNYSDDENMN